MSVEVMRSLPDEAPGVEMFSRIFCLGDQMTDGKAVDILRSMTYIDKRGEKKQIQFLFFEDCSSANAIEYMGGINTENYADVYKWLMESITIPGGTIADTWITPGVRPIQVEIERRKLFLNVDEPTFLIPPETIFCTSFPPPVPGLWARIIHLFSMTGHPEVAEYDNYVSCKTTYVQNLADAETANEIRRKEISAENAAIETQQRIIAEEAARRLITEVKDAEAAANDVMVKSTLARY